jgi:hypothetical protein
LRSPGLLGPPGARRAFAPGDLITQPASDGLKLAASLVFMIPPLDADAPVSGGAGRPRGRISSRAMKL